MSTANKLTYLNGTKQAIKQAINEDFEVIDDNTTFREYADKISSNNAKYKDLIPKETTNATNTLDISNSSGLDKALVTQYGNTYQETTIGKNLLPFPYFTTSSPFTNNGITYTINNDGTINVNGTATGRSSMPLYGNYLVENQKDLTGRYIKGGTNNVNMYVFSNGGGRYPILAQDTGQGAEIDTSTYKKGYIELVIVQGTTVNNELIKPMVVDSLTDTSYEPYTNGASPNPDYPQTITNVTGTNTIKINGKNLFDKDSVVSGFVNADGTVGGDTNAYRTSDFIPIQPNTAYYKTNTASPRTKYFDSNKQPLNTTAYQDISIGGSAGTFTTPNNAYYLRFSYPIASVDADDIQIEQNTSFTEYEPYQEQSFDLDLKSKNLYDIQQYLKQNDRGITPTYNQNSSITLSGTATASYSNFGENVPGVLEKDKTYTLSVTGTKNFSIGCRVSYNDNTYDDFNITSSNTYIKITPTKDVSGFRIYMYSLTSGTSYNATLFFQLEKGSTATEYEPYYDINLCKIDTYKDRIYPLNGKWYLEKKIGKVVLDGSEYWQSYINAYNNLLTFRFNFADIKSANQIYLLSNYFKNVTDIDVANGEFRNRYNNYYNLEFVYTDITSVTNFKTWLSTHNTTVYYILATPTTEEITESNYPTLYNQLNNIKLFEGVNHITLTNESGLDVEFDIEYYKDWKLD